MKMFFRIFCKFIKNLNSLIYQSIRLNSLIPFGSNYSFRIFWRSLCTDPLKLFQMGWETSVNCHFLGIPKHVLWTLSLGFGYAPQGQSETFPKDTPALSCQIQSRFSLRTSMFGCIHPSLYSDMSHCPCYWEEPYEALLEWRLGFRSQLGSDHGPSWPVSQFAQMSDSSKNPGGSIRPFQNYWDHSKL